VEDTTGVNLMGIAGELDMQARAIDLAQFPVYQENAEANDFHMLMWPQAQASGATLMFNQSYPDPLYRELFQNQDFRIAMSHAIDREVINDVAFLGQGVPRTESVVPASPYYLPEIENVNGEFDPELATQLLEGTGLLAMGDDGYYTFADGSELLIVIETSITATGMSDTLELISQWWDEIGIRNRVDTMTRDAYWPRAGANEVMVATWTTDRGLVPMVDPIYQFPFDERSWMGPAFGMYYKTGGVEGEAPPAYLQAALDLYDEYKVTTDPARQVEIGQEIVRMGTEGMWTMGTVGLVPNPVVVKNNFMNVPELHTADWIIMTPGTTEPAAYYFAE
jgi:peptide/nickel transport system substrate-binding protein